MITVNCEQGSREWHQARAGVITASMFSVARKRVGELTEQQATYVAAVRGGAPEKDAATAAGYKSVPRSEIISRAIAGEHIGDYSDEAKNYAFRLAIERISGVPLSEGYETYAMSRGHELEPAARAAHEIAAGVVVNRCGFVLTDDCVFGGSADGLIGDDAGSEYKCLIAPDRLRAIHIDGDISEFTDQVQGCLWLTGRKVWHFALYCPALQSIGRELWWREIPRDEAYIESLERDLVAFKALVDSYEARLREDIEIAEPAGNVINRARSQRVAA